MCEHPIIIKNPTKKYANGTTKPYLIVPCGNCPSCRQQQREEWFVRASSEYKNCVETKGRCLFVTLTYNPNCLPKLDLETWKLRHGDNKPGVSCFDKADIDRFRNTMNKKFERKGVTGLRYFICSEYGQSEGSTFRPHYHGLIFIPKCRLGDVECKRMMEESWHAGFVSYGSMGAFVRSDKAVGYVCKYVCKDMDFFGREDIKTIMHNKTLRKKLYRFMPRHYQSQGLGGYLAQWLLHNEDIYEAFKNGIGQSFLGQGVDRFYQIPRYIKNKILYKDIDGVRYPSDIGSEILRRTFDWRLQESTRTLSKCFVPNALRTMLDSDEAYKIIPIYRQLNYENSYRGLRGYLMDLLGNRTLTELSLYKKVFAYRSLPEDATDENVALFNALDVDDLSFAAHYLNDFDVSEDVYYSISDEPWKDKIDFEFIRCYNSLERFKDFDELLDAISKIQSLSASRRTAKKDADDKIINKLKNTLHN